MKAKNLSGTEGKKNTKIYFLRTAIKKNKLKVKMHESVYIMMAAQKCDHT